MPEISQVKTQEKLKDAIVATLAFFALYEVPLSLKRTHELLFGLRAEQNEVAQALKELVAGGKVIEAGGLYSVKPWNQSLFQANQLELIKKWDQIDGYSHWLAVLPFVRNISVINSLSLGTADSDSDIDFFVVTKNNRLYFVRSVIIVLFRLLGVYKTREKIKDRFCFGFFVTPKSLQLESLLLKPQDPYLMFWLANMRPVLGAPQYWQLMQSNAWLAEHFPNFDPLDRLASAKKTSWLIKAMKSGLEILLFIPASLAEPILRRIHIGHTFKLAENRSVTSTTIANTNMLKLHAADVRAEVAKHHEALLQSLQ